MLNNYGKEISATAKKFSLTGRQTVKQENASLLKKKNNANNNRLSSQSLLTRIAPFTSRQYLPCYHNCMVCWLLVPPHMLSLLLAQEIHFQVILLEQDFIKCSKVQQTDQGIIVVFYYMIVLHNNSSYFIHPSMHK